MEEAVQAERAAKRWQLRLKESEERVADLDARAGLAKQRIAILEQELDAAEGTAKDLQGQLAAQKTAAAAERGEFQVCQWTGPGTRDTFLRIVQRAALWGGSHHIVRPQKFLSISICGPLNRQAVLVCSASYQRLPRRWRGRSSRPSRRMLRRSKWKRPSACCNTR